MIRYVFLSITLAALTVGGLSGCQEDRTGHVRESAGPPLARVTVIRPERKALVRSIELPGHAEAYEVTPLYARVSGYVASVPVDIGTMIKGPSGDQPGTLLCELLVPELREELTQKSALVKQAEAEVLQADAGIKLAEASVRSAAARVEEARAAVAREDAQLARWQSEFERVVQLADTGAVTRKIADETRAQLETSRSSRQEVAARIDVATALQQESEAALDKARSDAAAVRSQLAVAQAEERRLGAMLGYATIQAPFDGVIVERNVHTGHLVSVGSSGHKPLLVAMRLDPIRVMVDVPENDAIQIQPGAAVELRSPASAEEPYIGKITRISWSLDNASRTMQAEIDVPNPDGRWRPGQFVQVKLTVKSLENALSLPKTAIVTQDKQTWCYAVDAQDTVVRLPVSLGLLAGTDYEIREGLSGDERVIGVNPNAFRVGQIVEVSSPPAPATAK